MAQLPGGTVTLLFTDIEGSTALLQVLGERYGILLADHHRILRGAFADQGGAEVDSAGDGLFTTFPSARAALLGAIEAQRGIAAATWPGDATVRVRMGLHTGEPRSGEGGYVGIDVHRAARICAAGHGGQILVSQTSRDLLTNDLPGDVSLLDLGEHRLKGIDEAQRLYQVAAPGLATSFGPLRTAGGRPNNLPRELTSFVGRDRQLEAASRILATTPLLTLVGPGGVGKTRLALRLAVEHLDEYDEGAWLVELGSVEDGALVFQTIAATMAIAEQPGKDIESAVLDHLRTGSRLLILDNCEHVLEATAAAVHRVLATCPDVRVMATSREGLGIPGEALYPVPSLSLPEGTPAGVMTSGWSEAVTLFVERAAAVRPGFRVAPDNAAAIAQLVRRLDGIPLALELAAARTRVLTVDQIAARLDDQFRLLAGGSRVAVPRHQTLQATMDWSYDLLTDDERAVLRRLAVFAGSLTLEAAESVCGIDPVDPIDVLDLLTRLVDKSLVVAEPTGEGRYRLLETLRQYARDKLIEAGEAEVIRRRHRDWYQALVERAAPEFFHGPESGAWLDRLGLEHDNLRAALQWSAGEAEEPVAGLRLATGLWRFWEIRGHPHEGRAWLERMLAAVGPDRSSLLVADALVGAGVLASMQGDDAAAVAFDERSLAIQRRLGDPTGISYAVNNLANVAVRQGDFARARSLYTECVALARSTGDERGQGFALINLAGVAAHLGDEAGARAGFEESIAIFERFGDRWGIAFAQDEFATVLAHQGDASTAGSLHEMALETWRELGDQRGVARALVHLADVAEIEGDLAEARNRSRQSLAIRQGLGDMPGIAGAMEKLAWVLAPDQPEAAARLIGCSEALREAIRAPIPAVALVDHARRLAALRERLGETAFADALGEGRTMAPVEVVATLPA
jgi:predicted ATPase/class 3 adenylate cyclase